MYTDIDSILFSCGNVAVKINSERWISRIDATVLSREEVALLYGCWADDAAAAGLIGPVRGDPADGFSYAA